jgi:cell division protein FtsL
MSSEEINSQPVVLTPAQRVSSDWRSLVEKVSYKAIVNNIPFLAFLVLLCVLYIANSHRAIEIQREINAQNKTLKELRWKYMDVKSQLMYVKTETQVIKRAETIGLKPSLLPAYKITIPPTPKGGQVAGR